MMQYNEMFFFLFRFGAIRLAIMNRVGLVMFLFMLMQISLGSCLLVERQDFSNSLSNIVSCLELACNSLIANSSVVFFSDELKQFEWANVLLRAIKIPKIVMMTENARDLFAVYILFFNFRNESYKKTFSSKSHWKSKFILVWQNIPTIHELKEAFHEFWYHHYINVLGVVDHIFSFKFYSFSPYSDGKCSQVSEPFIVNEWNISSREFTKNDDWFPRKLRDFGGCPLKAIGNHQPPDNIMKFEGKWKADGVGSKVLQMAEQYLNFTSIIVPTRPNASLEHVWYYFDKELQYITEAMYQKKADFAFGWFSYVSIAIDHLDLTMELGRVSSIDCFGWAVPYRAGKKPPNYSLYIGEFKAILWSLIIVTFCFTCLVCYFVVHREFIPAVLLVYKAFLEQPVNQLRKLASFRIAFVSFCFYSLVVSAAYKASFSSFLSVPFHGKEFMTVKNILHSPLQIQGSPEMLKILQATALQTNNGDEVIKRFHVLKPCNFESVMKKMIRQRNIAVLGVKRNLYYHSLREAKRLKVKIPVRFLPGCLIRPHSTHFMYRRGSHFIEPFNEVLNRLFESGVIPHWILHLGSNKILPIERLRGRTMTLCFLKEPFFILIVGYMISAFVFIGEIVHYRIKKD